MTTVKVHQDNIQQRRSELVTRQGELILLLTYFSLLAGRFTLERVLDDSLLGVNIDPRWVALAVILLLTLAWYAGLRRVQATRNKMAGMAPFVMWGLWLIISAQWAPSEAETSMAQVDIVFLLSFLILAWFVMSYLRDDATERIWLWVLTTGIIYFALALASGPDLQGRFSAPGGGPNTFVRIMVLSVIAALYLVVVQARRWPLATLPIFMIGAVLSGSRGGVLSAILIFLVFLVPLVKMLRVRLSLALGLVGVSSVYVASVWQDGYVLTVITERFVQQTLVEGHTAGRDVIVDQAWSMFSNNPIFGVGMGGFDVLESSSRDYGYAHNLVLATLSEAGVIGGLLLAIALLNLFLICSQARLTGHTLFALMAGLFFLGTTMFSGDYYDSRFAWFFLAMAAISSYRKRDVKALPQ